MAALKPCPFYGGKADSGVTRFIDFIYCTICQARVEEETEEQAIKSWNTRAEKTCHIRPTTKDDDPYDDGSTLTCLECGFPWLDEFDLLFKLWKKGGAR